MAGTHIVGCILGTALGDSIGLPYEGLSKRRQRKLFGTPDRHRFLFGRGMVSDDTEHTCMAAQALISSGFDEALFCRSLGWRFRFWLASIPAGIGLATLRSIIRLWMGMSPMKSGVFSAGNGPAMRAAIFGAAIDDRNLIRVLVRASSRITHTDPKAEYGAFAVALAAQMSRQQTSVKPNQFVDELRAELAGDGGELLSLIADAVSSVNKEESTQAFADSLGLANGVSGYVYHTVPVAIHAWLSHPDDFRSAIVATIKCGGDTDSTAAIVGGISGSGIGEAELPADWIAGLCDWPHSVSFMKRLGLQLQNSIDQKEKARPVRLPIWGVLLRNLFFVFIVLLHAFRRLLPPY